jgi:hypothetical protein
MLAANNELGPVGFLFISPKVSLRFYFPPIAAFAANH